MQKKDLVKAAKELNKVLGLEPEIDTKQDIEKLSEELLVAADLIEPEDDISEETAALIEELGAGDDSGEEEAPPKEEPPKKETKKETKPKAPPKPKKEETAPAPEKPKKPKAPTTEKVTRLQAAGKAVSAGKENGGADIDVLVKNADAIYSKAGGSSNLKESAWAVKAAVQVLAGFGAIDVEGTVVK